MNKVVSQAARCFFRQTRTDHTLASLNAETVSQRYIFKRTLSTAKPENETSKNINNKVEGSDSENKEKIGDPDLSDEIKKLNENIAELKDKYQRSLAENENVRKRLRKEIGDAKLYAIQGFCKDLLDVANVLDTAVQSVPEEILNESCDHPNQKAWLDFYNGVTMTKAELLSVFKRHGLVPYTPSKGDKFDPNIHDAMFQAPVPDLESGLVAHVQSIGYSLHDRTLKPAQVGVSK